MMKDDVNNDLPVPGNEAARIEALKNYNILDTLPEEEYDAITKLTSYICQVPITLISLIDENRQWFKSRVGLPVPETPRDISFCQYAIMDQHIFEIPDARKDNRFAANPLVTGDPNIRFYAGAPLVTPDGFSLGTLCVIDTQPKQLSEEQKEALRTLAKAVVSQFVLREQKKKLEEEKEKALNSVKIKEQFMANMSHEIRTPLNGIMGLTNLLISTAVTSEQLSYLQYIKKSADNLMVIINDILDFSKIESGKLSFESLPLNLSNIITSVSGLYSAKAEEKGLLLETTLAQDIPEWLTGDSVRLSQVLNNLIDNAIKFTQKGKVTLSVSKKQASAQLVTLLFTVTDTGIGIEEDKQAMIFESFTQANNDTTRKYGGTGLGLAISKGLVEAQGGKMWVTSRLGHGSGFSFTLTFGLGASTSAAHTANQDIQATPGKMRVLVAEDNEVNQLITLKILRSKNYEPVIAVNGLEAIQMFKESNFDIVLMDIQMPEMDGYEAIQHIRSYNGPNKDIPIIALTAHAIKEEVEKCFQAGANDYLSKPFDPDQLIEKIQNLVKK